MVIVGDNGGDAIEAYLRRHHLIAFIDGIVGRFDGMRPRLLQPHPFLLERGLTIASRSRHDGAVVIGDAVSDIEAGRAAGVATIGYANEPGKRERLTAAGADAVIDAMRELVACLTPTR